MPPIRRNPTFAVVCLIAALAAFVVLLLFHSNPFGNIPDGVMDESPFVYGALSAIANHTLLGLDFTPGGAYYGNLTAYTSVTFIAMKLAYLRGLAVQAGAPEISFRFGDLTHLVRLANALFVLLAAAAMTWCTFRDHEKDPEGTVYASTLLWLLLADSLFVTIAPTGKVWVIAMVLELAAAWLVARQERLTQSNQGMRPSRYAAVLIWIGFLACLQNVTGVMTFLWVAYALVLGHIKIKDILKAMLYSLPAWLLLLGLDAAFIKRFVDAMIGTHGLTQAGRMAFTTSSGSLDVFRQFTWTVSTVFLSATLAVVTVPACFMSDLFRKRVGWERSRRWTTILYLHVILTLIGYHFVFGLAQWTRYVLPLTVALCVAACFLPKPRRAQWALLVMAVLIGIVVSGKAASLWMKPSSESEVVAFLQEEVQSNDAIVVQDKLLKLPSDLTWPTVSYNDGGLAPVPVTQNVGHVWTVTSGCVNACQSSESACRAFVAIPCDKPLGYPQEGETLNNLFNAERLGGRYFVRTSEASSP